MGLSSLRELAEKYEASRAVAPDQVPPADTLPLSQDQAPPASKPEPKGAQITLLQGGKSAAAVFDGEDWAEYQAIYNAVEAYHRRHRGMDGGWEAWQKAAKDISQVYEQLNKHPLAFKLLAAVFDELARVSPPPPPGDEAPRSGAWAE